MKRRFEEDVGGDDGDDEEANHRDKQLKGSSSPNNASKIVCPYLDTINRRVLDFDFEKVCSVSVSNLNVYCCLVCGKYFQGRAPTSFAYQHSIDFNHHMFMNLNNAKIYCLPDDYVVEDASLADIKFLLNPTFTAEQVAQLDSSSNSDADVFTRCDDGTEYLPGLVGLNNLKHTDYLNVVVQMMSRIVPIRNYFLYEFLQQQQQQQQNGSGNNRSSSNTVSNDGAEDYRGGDVSSVSFRFSELMRKLWNARNFKNHVSPHELMQVIITTSKRFAIGTKSDPLDLFMWLANALHREIKHRSNVIFDTLQGEVKTWVEEKGGEAKATTKPFLFLTLNLPQEALFRDKMQEKSATTLSQVSLFQLMRKFDGQTAELSPEGHHIKYSITKLPPYLLLHYRRFQKNDFYLEKNKTIVNFPQKNFNLAPYTRGLPPGAQTHYDLVATIIHHGHLNDQGSFSIIVHRNSSERLYECDDLKITPVQVEYLAVAEAYIQVYQLQK